MNKSLGLWMITTGLLLQAVSAVGQNFPSKPIRLVTPGTGGSGDLTGRLIAQGLSANVGQQVIVDNRPSGVIPGEIVANAPPDGYTLLVSANTMWITSLLQNTPYDPVNSFSSVTLVVTTPNILFTHPSLPVKTVRDLIALARSKPGVLSYSSGAAGSPAHIAGEMFRTMARIDIVNIRYKSQSLAANDLLSGQVQFGFSTAPSKMGYVKAGKLKALAITTAQPSALFPELPTMASAGLQGYESVGIYGLFAPAKTPDAIINQLNQEVVKVLNRSDVKERFFNSGSETVGSSPKYLADAVKSELERVGKLLKSTAIRAE